MNSKHGQVLIAAGLVGALASTLTTSLRAEDGASAVATKEPAEAASALPLYRPLTLGIEAATTGAGAYLSWRFADHWGARTGFDYFEVSDNNLSIGRLHYDAELRLLSEPLTLDIYPWKKHSFHVSVGALFNQNLLTGSATDAGKLINAVIGTVSLRVEQQPVAPYLSIGGNFFCFDHAHHWALGGELGVAYTGDPKVSLTTSSSSPLIDAVLRHEQAKVQDWANQFTWYPVVKLQVSYSF